MKKSSKSVKNIQGTVSAEAAVTSAAMIILFAVFLSVAGYCMTAAKVRTLAAEKAAESSIAMYAAGVTLPATLYNGRHIERKVDGARNLRLFGITSEDCIEVVAHYAYPSVFGDMDTEIRVVCTLWKGDEKKTMKCVWDLAPNKRGIEIQKIFGGNLPGFFPVIDCFDFVSGQATSIISMDTTLEVYGSGTEIRRVILEKASQLRDFKGGKCGDVEIKEGDVYSRKLLVILPENSLSEVQESSLEDALLNTAGMGLEVEARRFQYVRE